MGMLQGLHAAKFGITPLPDLIYAVIILSGVMGYSLMRLPVAL